MKIRLAKVYLFLILFACGCGYDNDTSEFLNGRMLFLGDSITHNGAYVSFIEHELRKTFPERDFDIIAIGLSSETASGLTEPDHAYRRPCVHDRIDSALAKIKPDVVSVCYGMNDGIYHPQSNDRFAAYKNGIVEIIEKIKARGARVILITPPPFDPHPIPHKVGDDQAEHYGYANPYYRYDLVLADYSAWLMTLHQPRLLKVDVNTAMTGYLAKERATNAAFCLSPDGVHPDSVGHLLMSRTFLGALGIPDDTTDVRLAAAQIQRTDLYQLIDQRRTVLGDAWRAEIGHTHRHQWEGLPVAEAERKALELRNRIHQLAVPAN
ncbi:MAG TPA: SGNH/GDSL hydrolase family protein [bacterium]